MTDEVKTEATEVKTQTPETATVTTPPVAEPPKKKTQQELQGKKETTKKKVRRYSKQECQKELTRLGNGNHQTSKYYLDVQERMSKVA